MTARKKPEELRSFRWFGPDTLRGFSHRSRMLQLGFHREDFIGKPVIAIINTWSEINPCHAHLRERAEAVKRGVWQAGGFPVEIPAFSITETYMKPSPMLYRNLLAMDTEEALRSLPVDGAVLMGGCDKTTPASADGRDQHESAGDLSARRAHAARQLERQNRSAAAPTFGSSGPSAAPATSPTRNGTASSLALRARPASA